MTKTKVADLLVDTLAAARVERVYGVAGVPASVTVPAGNNTASFAVTTQTVTSITSAVITATLGSSSQQATLTPPSKSD